MQYTVNILIRSKATNYITSIALYSIWCNSQWTNIARFGLTHPRRHSLSPSSTLSFGSQANWACSGNVTVAFNIYIEDISLEDRFMFEIRYIEIYFCCVAFNAIRTTEITADSEAWKNSKRLIRFEVLQVQAPEVIANHDEKSEGRRKGGRKRKYNMFVFIFGAWDYYGIACMPKSSIISAKTWMLKA